MSKPPVFAFFPLALGLAWAQNANNVFEKAPPDVDDALRARITQFYQDFVDGKFRQADAFVAEDSKDVFFAMEKKRYGACALGNVTYSDNFTKARAVTTCDTEYFMMGRPIPIKLPISSMWKIENGEWVWYVIPISQRTEMNTPFGPVKVPPPPAAGEQTASSPSIAMKMVAPETVLNGVKVDRDAVEFNPSKSSKQEVQVTNTLPGPVTITVDTGIAGVKVTPERVSLNGKAEATFSIAFDAHDPKILCKECMAHPQSRTAGDVNLRVEPTGQVIPLHINFVLERQTSN